MPREYMPYGSVLVVDDVVSNAYVAKGMLLPYGLQIDTAVSGFEAIEKIAAGNVYDIVFMDHMMPKMDGIEATNIMRGMGYTHNIIALTANALVGQAEKFLESGFDGFISKPIDSRELNSILNKFIRDKKPSEVVETARHKQRGQREQCVERSVDKSAFSLGPAEMSDLKSIFMLDAENALNVLEHIAAKPDALSDTDVYNYEIATHGMKTALANVGESDLSGLAHRLELAAVEKNLDLIRAETAGFINALKALTHDLQNVKSTDADEAGDEEFGRLREKLSEIIATCEALEKNTAKAIVDELMHEIWPDWINEALDEISVHLLHSAFNKAIQTAEHLIAVTTKPHP